MMLEKSLIQNSFPLTLEKAFEIRNEYRNHGLKLSVTNGCFDLLHRGHVTYLAEARSLADRLFVLINSDESIHALKGPTRPLNSALDRAFVLSSLRFVDGVVIFNTLRCHHELEVLSPDVYVKGGDYTIDSLAEEERCILLKMNTKIHFIPFVKGYSTTSLIERFHDKN